MSKRGADGHFVGWPGSVKVSGKKFFTAKISNERKKFLPGTRRAPTLTVREGKLSLTKPKFNEDKFNNIRTKGQRQHTTEAGCGGRGAI
jgi:hypothetical protein